jgi:DNA-binding GntR family transcriptional regulator
LLANGKMSNPTKKSIVYKKIKNSIISGEIKPGEILNEGDLANKYHIGKTPTREALIVLTHDKLLEALPRTGYIVTKIKTRDILEVFHLRILLEVEAIGLAVEKITDKAIAELLGNNKKEVELSTNSSVEDKQFQAYQLNCNFHMIIARTSGNLRLAGLVETLMEDVERMLIFNPYIVDAEQHTDILKQLINHDKSKAQDAMREHIENTKSRILAGF